MRMSWLSGTRFGSVVPGSPSTSSSGSWAAAPDPRSGATKAAAASIGTATRRRLRIDGLPTATPSLLHCPYGSASSDVLRPGSGVLRPTDISGGQQLTEICCHVPKMPRNVDSRRRDAGSVPAQGRCGQALHVAMLPLLRQGLFWADGVDRLRHHRGSTGTDCPC